MVVSGLALMVSLANPAMAAGQGACAQDIDCIAGAASVAARYASADLPLPMLLAMQDGSLPDARTEDEEAADASEGDVIVVQGEVGTPEGDPAEQVNVAAYKAVQAVDEAVVEPIAQAYDKGIPSPLRQGLRNFLRNLGEPISFLNFMLQLKPGKAMKVLGRFAINTTLGIGGLFDHASKQPFNIEYRYNGLANTLGYYGVGPGPYLYLPFIGSTTVRDLGGRLVDFSILPAVVGPPLDNPYYSIPVGALTSLESRIDVDTQIDAVREKCGDPYAANRDLYLIQRQVEIDRLRGKVRADLGEIQERLEFNCDIEIETGYVPHGSKDFIERQTTLLRKEDAGEASTSPDDTSDETVTGGAASE